MHDKYSAKIDSIVKGKISRLTFHELHFKAYLKILCDNQFKPVLENSCYCCN